MEPGLAAFMQARNTAQPRTKPDPLRSEDGHCLGSGSDLLPPTVGLMLDKLFNFLTSQLLLDK